jgi:hypothetical protein
MQRLWQSQRRTRADAHVLPQVMFLTYVSVNFFVAVITTVFMDQRSLENPGGGFTVAERKSLGKAEEQRQRHLAEWSAPAYFVPALGGRGPYAELEKPTGERQGLIWHRRFEQVVLTCIFVNTAVRITC